MIDTFLALSGSLNLLIAGIVFSKGRRSLSHRSFAFLSLSMALWSFSYLFYSTPPVFDYLFWIKAINFIGAFIVAGMFYFAYAFPKDELPPKPLQTIFVALNSLILYMLLLTDQFIAGVTLTDHGPEIMTGPFYIVVALIWIPFALLSIVKFVQNFLSSSGTSRLQFLYIFLGLGIVTTVAIAVDAVAPIIFGTSRYFPLSAASSVFFVALTSYAIIKHRLLDLRLAFQEISVFLINASVVSAASLLFILIYWRANGRGFDANVVPFAIAAGITVTLLFDRLTTATRNITDKYLFHSLYDYQTTLRELSRTLATILDLGKLTEVILSTLAKTLEFKRGSMMIMDGKAGKLKTRHAIGLRQEQTRQLEGSDDLISLLKESPSILGIEEIKDSIEDLSQEEKNAAERVIKLLEDLKLDILVPIISNDALVGVITLGEKSSTIPYTVQDFNLLTTAAAQAGVAIENAELYQELADFNNNLQKRVDEATTELRQKNAEIGKAYEELKSLDSLKDQLISITSHELNTPASIVQNYLWLVLNQPSPDTKLSAQDRKSLERSFSSIQDLIKLVGNILNASRIEAGKLVVDLQVIKPVEVITEIVEELQPRAKERNLTFTVDPGINKLPDINADRLRFKEIITNLITNAVKYTDQGGLEVSAESNNDFVTFTVSDTGRGIAPEHLSHMFEKFYREDTSLSASTPRTGGTGLGLYITKNYVELMGGQIWVDSVQGQGSKFHFTIPVAKVLAPAPA